MKYWYKKEQHQIGGMAEFWGYREIIHKGENEPEEIITRYVSFPSNGKETMGENWERWCEACKKPTEEFFAEFDNAYIPPWKVKWKILKEYNEAYYDHDPKDIEEITEKEFEEITKCYNCKWYKKDWHHKCLHPAICTSEAGEYFHYEPRKE